MIRDFEMALLVIVVAAAACYTAKTKAIVKRNPYL